MRPIVVLQMVRMSFMTWFSYALRFSAFRGFEHRADTRCFPRSFGKRNSQDLLSGSPTGHLWRRNLPVAHESPWRRPWRPLGRPNGAHVLKNPYRGAPIRPESSVEHPRPLLPNATYLANPKRLRNKSSCPY